MHQYNSIACLNRYIAGDGRALAVSVKTGSSAEVVCGTDINGLVLVAD